MKSCSVTSRRCWVLNVTSFASVHKTARCLLRGHALNWGYVSHSTVIRSGSVPSIRASLPLVHFQKRFPSAHSMRRCCTLSTVAQFPHFSIRTFLSYGVLHLLGECRVLLYNIQLCLSLTQGLLLHFSTMSVYGIGDRTREAKIISPQIWNNG